MRRGRSPPVFRATGVNVRLRHGLGASMASVAVAMLGNFAACVTPAPGPGEVEAPRAAVMSADGGGQSLLAPAGGDGVVVSTKDGLVVLNAQLQQVSRLHPERGRHLRISDGKLYYFDRNAPRLRSLDLQTGESRMVVELPLLRNECFDHGRPVDPLKFVHRQEDLAVAGGILCLDLRDHPGDRATEVYNLRVDLTDGTVEQRMVEYLGGDVCGRTREREQPRVCDPTKLASPPASKSPSGQWNFLADTSRSDRAAEQVYVLAAVIERATNLHRAIFGRRLRVLRDGSDSLVGACMIPEGSPAAWMSRSDVLVLAGCRDRLAFVYPPERVEYFAADGFAVVPR